MKNSSWDLDYRDGLEGESLIADLLHLDTVEVKKDRRWIETGNIYIETECYYQNENEWRPSGIRVSEATHWAFVLEDLSLIIERYRLIDAVHEHGKPITCNIPPNPSRGYLINVGTLIEAVRGRRNLEIQEHNAYEESRLRG
jgi:hypothetical protein